jgi:hypothetical protein
MSSALMKMSAVLRNDLKGKSREELLSIRAEAEKRETHRIANVDWDDCFVSSSIDRTTISIIDSLLDARIKRDLTNEVLTIEGYTITILEADKQHYHIVNNELKLDVNYFGCGYGNVTGKGARKYMDELENLNKQVKKYIKVNQYVA